MPHRGLVTFTAADAVLRLGPAMPPEKADKLARNVSLGPDWFDWFKAARRLGRRLTTFKNWRSPFPTNLQTTQA